VGLALIEVEVIYCARPGHADSVSLQLAVGTLLRDALQASGLLERHALSIEGLRVGIWSREKPLATPLRDRDRVEIYRPLVMDPKEARRLRHRNEGGAARKARAKPARPPRAAGSAAV
jgi:uncharacterized protein